MKLPTVLEQSRWHPPFSVAHSSISVQVSAHVLNKFLEYIHVGQLYPTKIRACFTTNKQLHLRNLHATNTEVKLWATGVPVH